MIRYRIEETINRPADEVFAYIGDPSRHPAWMPVSDVRIATPGEVRVGTAVHELMKMGSRNAPFSWEVTELEAGRKLGFRTIEGPVSWEGSYEAEPVGSGVTRVIATATVGLKGWQRLMEPFMAGEVRRGEAAELRRLKDLLEGHA